MKYLFCVFGIFSFILSSFAQNSGYTYEPLGHTTSYEQGYYYATSGEKKSGLIKWECSGYSREIGVNFILFKSAVGEKKVKLTTNDVKAFVIGKDSFTVIENFSRSGMITIYKDFAHVVLSGTITLYSHCQETNAGSPVLGSVSTGIECFYFIRKEGVLYRLKRKDFKSSVAFLFGDNNTLMNEFNNGVWTFDNIELMVTRCNSLKAAELLTPTQD